MVGGGNSAGQEVIRFSRYADQVTLLVRDGNLGASMSQYLVDRLAAISNLGVRLRAEVAGGSMNTAIRSRMRGLDVPTGSPAG
jgi:thioredoxin reductase (NADPH)